MNPAPQPPQQRSRPATADELLDTIELWPLDWWARNGQDVCETAKRFRVALQKLAAEPPSHSVLGQTADAA